MQTGDFHPYIAAAFVLFGILKLEDKLCPEPKT